MENKTAFHNTIKVVVIGILLFCGIQYYKLFLQFFGFLINLIFPFILGGAIAFVINVPMSFIERHLFQSKKKFNLFRRPISYLLTLIFVFGLLGLAMFVILPQLSDTLRMLTHQIPSGIKSIQQWIYNTTANLPSVRTYVANLKINWANVSTYVINFITNTSGSIFSSGLNLVSGIIGGVTTFIIAFIFSIYILFQKEKLSSHVRQVMYALLPEAKSDEIVRIGKLANKTFRNFLSGQCIEAMILGFMFFITLTIFQFPYALLIGVIIAITALIPIFGAFLGCAVGIFLIIIVNPVQAFWFVVVFLILQQIEGNLIYPHVVGSSVGLPAIWILVAVTVGGSLMGIAGILLFIPLCSVGYALFREFVKKRVKERNVSKKK